MNELPLLEPMLERYKHACELKQTVNPEAMIAAMTTWLSGITTDPFTVRIAVSLQDFFKAAADSWDDNTDDARYCADIEVATRFLRRTQAAQQAQAIWVACSDWLEGDWPRGIWDGAWWCITTIGSIETGDAALYRQWEPLLAAFEAGLWLFCITSQPELVLAPIPSSISLDAEGRLHRDDGPAFVWLDWLEYHWHGVEVPAQVILRPETITQDQIASEPNAKIRQVLSERYRAG
jgi:hypothetical protein